MWGLGRSKKSAKTAAAPLRSNDDSLCTDANVPNWSMALVSTSYFSATLDIQRVMSAGCTGSPELKWPSSVSDSFSTPVSISAEISLTKTWLSSTSLNGVDALSAAAGAAPAVASSGDDRRRCADFRSSRFHGALAVWRSPATTGTPILSTLIALTSPASVRHIFVGTADTAHIALMADR